MLVKRVCMREDRYTHKPLGGNRMKLGTAPVGPRRLKGGFKAVDAAVGVKDDNMVVPALLFSCCPFDKYSAAGARVAPRVSHV